MRERLKEEEETIIMATTVSKRENIHRGTTISVIMALAEIMEARKQWSNIFKVLKEKKKTVDSILNLMKISFENEDKTGILGVVVYLAY